MCKRLRIVPDTKNAFILILLSKFILLVLVLIQKRSINLIKEININYLVTLIELISNTKTKVYHRTGHGPTDWFQIGKGVC